MGGSRDRRKAETDTCAPGSYDAPSASEVESSALASRVWDRLGPRHRPVYRGDVKGFVLAAGFGTRLAPITETVPKALMPVGNVPLIGYSLRLLAHHGITEVAVNLHHLPKAVKEAVGDGSRFGVEVTYSHEEEILGTGGGLKQMADFLSETFVVVNADTVVDCDLTAIVGEHRANGALATMVLREDPRQDEFGLIELDSSSRIRRILGQGDTDQPLKPYMFTGVHVMEPRLLDYIPAGVNTCVNRYAYNKALQNDEPLYGSVIDTYWADSGTPSRYLRVNDDALERTMQLRHIDPLEGFAHAPTKDVAEVVRLGEGVQLGQDARLVPPVILGDGTKVGDNATVGPYCVVGKKVAIGKGARVSHSVVLNGSKIEGEGAVERRIVSKKATVILEEFTGEVPQET